MRILLLTKKFPFPKNDGESVAIHNMVTGLHDAGNTVDLLSFNTTKHFVDVTRYKDELHVYNDVTTVALDNRIKPISVFFNIFSGKSYHIDRFRAVSFSTQLSQILNQHNYDIIQIESIYLADYVSLIRSLTTAPIVLRTHNVEHLIWQRIVENTGNPIFKQYLNIQKDRLKAYEQRVLKDMDLILTMSQADADMLRVGTGSGELQVVPIFLDVREYEPAERTENAFSFIGSLDWMPNVEGLNWFFKKIWPQVIAEIPDARFYLAGRNPARHLDIHNVPNLLFQGAVPDAVSFINSYTISIVPLLSGSGQKVKLLESMALGRAIVTTTVGAEGITGEDGGTYYVTDDENAFAKAMIELYHNERKRTAMGEAARKVIVDHYDLQVNVKKLMKSYKSLLS